MEKVSKYARGRSTTDMACRIISPENAACGTLVIAFEFIPLRKCVVCEKIKAKGEPIIIRHAHSSTKVGVGMLTCTYTISY